jgi:hypothetical protein
MRKLPKKFALWKQIQLAKQPQATGKPRRIRPVSKRRQQVLKIYRNLRKAFLAVNKYCAVFGGEKATQVHHGRGRISTLLIDMRFWHAVSQRGHEWIGRNPEAARCHRWLCKLGEWNSPPNDETTRRLKLLMLSA